jgi:hypothetical protein
MKPSCLHYRQVESACKRFGHSSILVFVHVRASGMGQEDSHFQCNMSPCLARAACVDKVCSGGCAGDCDDRWWSCALQSLGATLRPVYHE